MATSRANRGLASPNLTSSPGFCSTALGLATRGGNWQGSPAVTRYLLRRNTNFGPQDLT